jgi:hypothetical protein
VTQALRLVAPSRVEYRQWLDSVFINGKRILETEFFRTWDEPNGVIRNGKYILLPSNDLSGVREVLTRYWHSENDE